MNKRDLPASEMRRPGDVLVQYACGVGIGRGRACEQFIGWALVNRGKLRLSTRPSELSGGLVIALANTAFAEAQVLSGFCERHGIVTADEAELEHAATSHQPVIRFERGPRVFKYRNRKRSG
jgi:hypothetical protein